MAKGFKTGSFGYAQDDMSVEDDFSRAYAKLRIFDESVKLGPKLNGKVVLDVGSSTGGFTKFALEKGAKKVIAVELGSRQMVPALAMDSRVKLYEKTDILGVFSKAGERSVNKRFIQTPDVVLMDVSFTGCREILTHLKLNILEKSGLIILLFKPQFEARESDLNNGIIKNSKIRRELIKEFELWLQKNKFIIEAKMDSGLAGSKGNLERFYVLRLGI
jgi:23S rRNA (cytidine1920-2'-O)/16S rRNA (cytidine1409-2'-O)-methyltransferase